MTKTRPQPRTTVNTALAALCWTINLRCTILLRAAVIPVIYDVIAGLVSALDQTPRSVGL